MQLPAAYHVLWDEEGNCWVLRQEGKSGNLDCFEKKLEAVFAAEALVGKEKRGQVIIHRKDGTIQKEENYGSIPYRFKK